MLNPDPDPDPDTDADDAAAAAAADDAADAADALTGTRTGPSPFFGGGGESVRSITFSPSSAFFTVAGRKTPPMAFEDRWGAFFFVDAGAGAALRSIFNSNEEAEEGDNEDEEEEDDDEEEEDDDEEKEDEKKEDDCV